MADNISIKLDINGLHAPFEYLKQHGRDGPGDDTMESNVTDPCDQASGSDPLNQSMVDKLENMLDYHESFNSGWSHDNDEKKMSDSALSSAALMCASFQSKHGHEEVIISELFIRKKCFFECEPIGRKPYGFIRFS